MHPVKSGTVRKPLKSRVIISDHSQYSANSSDKCEERSKGSDYTNQYTYPHIHSKKFCIKKYGLMLKKKKIGKLIDTENKETPIQNDTKKKK